MRDVKLKKKFNSFLRKGEKVNYVGEYWRTNNHGYQGGTSFESGFCLIAVCLSLISGFIIVLHSYFGLEVFVAVVLTIVLSFIIGWVYVFYSYISMPKIEREKLKSDEDCFILEAELFIVTDVGIRFFDIENKHHLFLYENLSYIDSDGIDSILLYDQSFSTSTSLKLVVRENIKEVEEILFDIWKKKGAFVKFDSILEIYAFQKKFIYENNGIPQIFGNYAEGKSIEMKLLKPHQQLSIQISLSCDNSENNYLYLRSEKSRDNIRKILGMQDYGIGKSWFDDDIIIQSNHEPFIQYVLHDESVLRNIHTILSDSRASISMGENQKMQKTNKIEMTEFQALDEHLIGESQKRIRTEGLQTELIFTNENWTKEKDLEKIAKEMIVFMDMMINLAKRVNQYQA